jgi:hypothetical protein
MKYLFHVTILFYCAFLVVGCVTIPNTPSTVPHAHAVPYVVSLGERHFHAAMEYSPSDGEVTIRFLDESEKPHRIFSAERAKAELIVPGKAAKMFYFKNAKSGIGHIPSGSYRYLEEAFTTHIEAKGNWLKDLSAFQIKAWLPVYGLVYEATFVYPEPSQLKDSVEVPLGYLRF